MITFFLYCIMSEEAIHTTIDMPDIVGILILICPALQTDKTILYDFILSNTRQITTGFYPRVLNDLAYKVQEDLVGDMSSAIIEWGTPLVCTHKVCLLVSPLPSDYKKYNWIEHRKGLSDWMPLM
jgi:hypothetical protein